MFTYQVKITVDAGVEAEWLQWMKTVHVPDVMATGLIHSYQILKPEDSAHTYLFHYHFQDEQEYAAYQQQHAPRLKAHVLTKYPGQFKAERQLLHWM